MSEMKTVMVCPKCGKEYTVTLTMKRKGLFTKKPVFLDENGNPFPTDTLQHIYPICPKCGVNLKDK